VANWGTHVLKLRLPSKLLTSAEVKAHRAGERFSAREKNGKVILTFSSEEEGGDWVDAEGILSALVPLRADLARGDRRALYLGWLVGAQGGELSDEDEEPPVPAGLSELSASLEALVEFLRIETDLLQIAAQASAPLATQAASPGHFRAWVATLPPAEKDAVLARLLSDDAASVSLEFRRRYTEATATRGRRPSSGRRRTVGELLKGAAQRAQERERIAAQKAAVAAGRRTREAAAARVKHLDSLAGKESKIWADVDSLIATKQPKNYDAAVRLLVDLRDLTDQKRGGEFRVRVEALRAAHVRKPTLLERISRAGI
jgi:hypothetical protein